MHLGLSEVAFIEGLYVLTSGVAFMRGSYVTTELGSEEEREVVSQARLLSLDSCRERVYIVILLSLPLQESRVWLARLGVGGGGGDSQRFWGDCQGLP